MYSSYYTGRMKKEELEMCVEIRTIDGLLNHMLNTYGDIDSITSGAKTVTNKEF